MPSTISQHSNHTIMNFQKQLRGFSWHIAFMWGKHLCGLIMVCFREAGGLGFYFLVIQKLKSSNQCTAKCVPLTVPVIHPAGHYYSWQAAKETWNEFCRTYKTVQQLTSRGEEKQKWDIFSYIFIHIFRQIKDSYFSTGHCMLNYLYSTKIQTLNRLKIHLCKALTPSVVE